MADQLWTLPEVIRHWATVNPDKPAFIFINKHGSYRTLTAGDVYLLAGRFASRLRQCGFQPGDVIANGLLNSPERVITDFGIVMARCISLNCQIVEKDGGDFWKTATVSGSKGAIFSDRQDSPAGRLFSEYVQDNSQNITCYRDISIPKAPLLTKAFVITRSRSQHEHDQSDVEKPVSSIQHRAPDSGCLNNVEEYFLSDLIANLDNPLVAECLPDEDVFIFTTSGSTGPCKLVPRTHRELLSMARNHINPTQSKYFNDRQLSWLGGFSFDYLGSCTSRLLQDCFDSRQAKTVGELWSLLEREQCDGAFLAPVDLISLAKQFQDSPPDFKLKFITTSGVTLRQNALMALGTITDLIINMYASTETGVITLLSIKNASEFKDCCCGRAPDNVQIKVVGDKMEDLPPGEEGHVLVKSKNMFRHYYNWTPPEPVFTSDGWFQIRDRGVIDEDGNLSVTCRQGDVISQGVILIYLSWPETVLNKCPDVTEVAAIGIQDINGDDCICACVVPRKDSRLTEEKLLHFYNDNFMLSLEKSILKPQISMVIFYDSLPYNSIGKLDKRKLRADALQRLKCVETTRNN